MVFSGILLNTNKNSITAIDILNEASYTRNVQTFQQSGTFIMSMNAAAWDGNPPLDAGYGSDSNITYTISTSSSGGITTVYIHYNFINTFDPTSNTKVPGLWLTGRTYYQSNNNLTITQFDNIPLSRLHYKLFQPYVLHPSGLGGITISATDIPYVQFTTNFDRFMAVGLLASKEVFEFTGRVDSTNARRFTHVFQDHNGNNNTNYNGWNINNNISLQDRIQQYDDIEQAIDLNTSVSMVYPPTGAQHNTFSHAFSGCTSWNNGHESGVGNIFTWAFCVMHSDMNYMFKDAVNCNIRFSVPFINPTQTQGMFQNCTLWNNGYAPGVSWSLKERKWTLGYAQHLNNYFDNAISFNGDFTGIGAPMVISITRMFAGCQSFDQDLTDFVLSWKENWINIDHMITGSNLSVENYSKFLIALKTAYDINNNRFNACSWTINQYYNSSAASARSALMSANKIFPTDLGLQP
jgi:hypothetical protein